MTQQERHTEDDNSLALTLGQNKPGSHVNVMEDYFYHLDNPVSIVPDVEPFYQAGESVDNHDNHGVPEHLSLDSMVEQYSHFENKESHLILKAIGTFITSNIACSLFLLKLSGLNQEFAIPIAYLFSPMVLMWCFIYWTNHSKRLKYYSNQRYQFQDWIIEKGRQAVSFTQGKLEEGQDELNNDEYETVDVKCSLKVYEMIRYQLSNTDGPELDVDSSMIDEYFQSLEDLKARKKEIRHEMMKVVGITVGSLTLIKTMLYLFISGYSMKTGLPLTYSIAGVAMGSMITGFFLYRDKVRKDSGIERLTEKVSRIKEKISHLKQRIKKQAV